MQREIVVHSLDGLKIVGFQNAIEIVYMPRSGMSKEKTIIKYSPNRGFKSADN